MGIDMSRNEEKIYRYQIERERMVFLPNRNVTTWNIIPSEVVDTDTVDKSKAKLDRNIKSTAPNAHSYFHVLQLSLVLLLYSVHNSYIRVIYA